MKRTMLPSAPSLGEKVAWLSDPRSYPEPTRAVEPIETHMAWVFLTDTLAYKLKKPVRFEYLDFSTLAARRRMCAEEVRLNRRLAPEVYLGTVPLRLGAGRRLQLDGVGRAVDWLVRMRRLPEARMLDRLIRRGEVPGPELLALGRVLGEFYRRASRSAVSPATYRARLLRHLAEIEAELLRYGASERKVRPVVAGLGRYLDREAELLRERVREGRIVEGHGDLRPEHVYLFPRPVVLDCIEFNREFRTLDPVDDLAFLAMDCARLGAPEIGPVLFREYRRVTGDRPPRHLIRFHAAFRAALRAKIAIWHLRDEELPRPRRWIARAESYLEIARRLGPWRRPVTPSAPKATRLG